MIERLFPKIKYCQRVATRYDTPAANYLALIQLTPISIWFGANEFAA